MVDIELKKKEETWATDTKMAHTQKNISQLE